MTGILRVVLACGAAALVVVLAAAPQAAAAAVLPADPADSAAPVEVEDGEEVEFELEDEQDCGFDVGCRVRQGFSETLAAAISDSFNLGAQKAASGLIHTDPPGIVEREAWGLLLGVVNSLFVVAVMAAGILLMGHHSVQTSYAARDLLARIVLGWLGANLSWWLCGHAILLTNAVSLAIVADASDAEAITGAIAGTLQTPLHTGIVMLLLYAVMSSFGFLLVFITVIEAMLMTLLVVVAPLALACHALPHLDGLARLWWRALGGLLLIQVAHAVVIMLAARLFLDAIDGTLTGLFTLLALLYILFRIPFWVFRRVMGLNIAASPLMRTAKTVGSLLIFRYLLRRAGRRGGRSPSKGGQQAGARGAGTTPHRPPPPPGPSSGSGSGQDRQEVLPGIDEGIDFAKQDALRRRQQMRQRILHLRRLDEEPGTRQLRQRIERMERPVTHPAIRDAQAPPRAGDPLRS